jgi:hypothetical protein
MDDLHSPAFEVLTVHSDCSVHFRHGAEFDETSAHCFPADWVIENVDEAFGTIFGGCFEKILQFKPVKFIRQVENENTSSGSKSAFRVTACVGFNLCHWFDILHVSVCEST